MKKAFIILLIICLSFGCCSCKNKSANVLTEKNSETNPTIEDDNSNNYNIISDNSTIENTKKSMENNGDVIISGKSTENDTSSTPKKSTSKNNSSTTSSKASTDTSSNSSTTSSKTTHVHKFSNATCTQAATCSCGATKGNKLGHNCNGETCTRCGEKNPNYIKTYSANEYWIVDGQWKFKIDSVKSHYLCNSYANKTDGYTNEQVITIKYSYEHIGYNGSNTSGLIFTSLNFNVYDEKGYSGEIYPCTHDKAAKYCPFFGAKSQGEESYYLSNDSTEVTITVKQYSGNHNLEQAKFKLSIS